jgi:hypothetical protein
MVVTGRLKNIPPSIVCASDTFVSSYPLKTAASIDFWLGTDSPEFHGVTVTLLNCEVLSVVVLPLATAKPI